MHFAALGGFVGVVIEWGLFYPWIWGFSFIFKIRDGVRLTLGAFGLYLSIPFFGKPYFWGFPKIECPKCGR